MNIFQGLFFRTVQKESRLAAVFRCKEHHVMMPASLPVPLRRWLGRIAFLLLAGLLAGCNSMELNKVAKKTGGVGRLKDESAFLGTFENQSVEVAHDKYMRLWEMLKDPSGPWIPEESSKRSTYSDTVRIAYVSPGLLEFTLHSPGRPKQTTRSLYSMRGRYALLRHDSEFDLLPVGYRKNSSDLAITATPRGDLVVLSRFDYSGFILIGGTSGSSAEGYRFPRQIEGKPSGVVREPLPKPDADPPRITELTTHGLAALERDARWMTAFIGAHVPIQNRSDNVLVNLDKACAAWLRSNKGDSYTVREVTDLVVYALGNEAVQRLGVHWVWVSTRQQGSQLGLMHTRPPAYVMPEQAILENLNARRTDFIVPLYREMEEAMKKSAR
jgi:hypothetical protein